MHAARLLAIYKRRIKRVKPSSKVVSLTVMKRPWLHPLGFGKSQYVSSSINAYSKILQYLLSSFQVITLPVNYDFKGKKL